ncbi:MAG: hypothetical protein WA851_13835, partial [Xanthobacteraceae bacterium]
MSASHDIFLFNFNTFIPAGNPTHKFTPNAKSRLSLEHAEKLFLESAFPLISDIIFSQREGGDVSGASLQRSLRPVRSSSTDGPI